jgi:hypothetical protein
MNPDGTSNPVGDFRFWSITLFGIGSEFITDAPQVAAPEQERKVHPPVKGMA